MGANSLPLNVVGKVLLPVKLGYFQQNQEFVVARNLSVRAYWEQTSWCNTMQAIIDCKAGKFSLKGAILPITMGNSVAPQDSPGVPVQVTETLEVPARSVMFIQATVQGGGNVHEGLLEPGDSSGLPKHLLVARSLSEVGQDQKVFAQVINISPDTVKLYKNMKVGEFAPRQYVQVIGDQEPDIPSPTPKKTEVDLTQADLSDDESRSLLNRGPVCLLEMTVPVPLTILYHFRQHSFNCSVEPLHLAISQSIRVHLIILVLSVITDNRTGMGMC